MNPLEIKLTGRESTTEKAIINVLNAITREMYEGRVKQVQKDIVNVDEKADSISSEMINVQIALCEQYEENLVLQDEVTNTQLALVELYEGGL